MRVARMVRCSGLRVVQIEGMFGWRMFRVSGVSGGQGYFAHKKQASPMVILEGWVFLMIEEGLPRPHTLPAAGGGL